ncbi:hypothetical protein VTO42DRAFT_7843 [Malbranchea cinnamomea]
MATGQPPSALNQALNIGAAASQNFDPVNQLCAHLYAYHVYASDPTRCVQANHYCSQVSQDMRQCLIYDSPSKNARLIGIEYMITPRVYESLPQAERKLWHSHVYEVKSGMLVMPTSTAAPVPTAVWNKAETTEMEQVIPLYGKTYHLWQVDRGDRVPMGAPELMVSFTSDEDVKRAAPDGLQTLFDKTKQTFGIDSREKAEMRKGLCPDVKIHPDADSMLRNTTSEELC